MKSGSESACSDGGRVVHVAARFCPTGKRPTSRWAARSWAVVHWSAQRWAVAANSSSHTWKIIHQISAFKVKMKGKHEAWLFMLVGQWTFVRSMSLIMMAISSFLIYWHFSCVVFGYILCFKNIFIFYVFFLILTYVEACFMVNIKIFFLFLRCSVKP